MLLVDDSNLLDQKVLVLILDGSPGGFALAGPRAWAPVTRAMCTVELLPIHDARFSDVWVQCDGSIAHGDAATAATYHRAAAPTLEPGSVKLLFEGHATTTPHPGSPFQHSPRRTCVRSRRECATDHASAWAGSVVVGGLLRQYRAASWPPQPRCRFCSQHWHRCAARLLGGRPLVRPSSRLRRERAARHPRAGPSSLPLPVLCRRFVMEVAPPRCWRPRPMQAPPRNPCLPRNGRTQPSRSRTGTR